MEAPQVERSRAMARPMPFVAPLGNDIGVNGLKLARECYVTTATLPFEVLFLELWS